MTKVSVVMPVYNASKFLNASITSILDQTLEDLELICVDDGSTDNSLDILNSFKEKDSRVKVISREHKGGGSARNYGMRELSGEYLYFMDADDILDLNAFNDFYNICSQKNLDFVVFKANNYGVEKDHYFETDYQNMKSVSDIVQNNVFDFNDLGGVIFDFNVAPWCKFYNMEFIKSTGAKFREYTKFHDNHFFWDIIFKAKRIYFLNEFYYTRKRYDDSLTSTGDYNHIDIIDDVNDTITLFIKHAKLERYKHELYNLKITWITDRYNQINDKFKKQFLKEMKKDYENIKDTEFPNILNTTEKLIFDSVLISKDYKEFDSLIRFYTIINENKPLNEKIPKLKSWFDSLKREYHSLAFKTLQKYFKENSHQIDSQNSVFYKNIINSNNTQEYYANDKISNIESKFSQLSQEEIQKEITTLLNDYKNDLITLENQKIEISNLNNKNKKYNTIINKNTIEISKLKSDNEYLLKKNDYQNLNPKDKNIFKKLFSKNKYIKPK